MSQHVIVMLCCVRRVNGEEAKAERVVRATNESQTAPCYSDSSAARRQCIHFGESISMSYNVVVGFGGEGLQNMCWVTGSLPVETHLPSKQALVLGAEMPTFFWGIVGAVSMYDCDLV